MRGAARLGLLLLSLLAAGERPAVAETFTSPSTNVHPARTRFVLGSGNGWVAGTPSASSARGRGNSSVASTAGILLGAERRLRDWLSLAASVEFDIWDASAATDAGYGLARVDMGLAPHVTPLRVGQVNGIMTEFFLTAPVGVTRPMISVPGRRAFDEHVDVRWGWYLGAGLGVVFLGDDWGGQFEAGYVRHSSGARSVFTPHDLALPPVVEDVDYVDHQIFFTAAVLFAL